MISFWKYKRGLSVKYRQYFLIIQICRNVTSVDIERKFCFSLTWANKKMNVMFIFFRTIYSIQQRELFAADVLQKFSQHLMWSFELRIHTHIYNETLHYVWKVWQNVLLHFYFLTIVLPTSLDLRRVILLHSLH